MAPERLTSNQLKDDPEIQLKSFVRTKDFFVAIDTDGCITDNMNGKQMLIFHPQFMEFFNLWGIETYYREVAEFYNLFSDQRGCNRFVAISLTLKALGKRSDVADILKREKIALPNVKILDEYIAWAKNAKLGLGNPSLEKYIDINPTNFFLYKLLGWSEAVNRTFPYISAKIPPFDGVAENLKMMSEHADVVIVSKTPYEDLVNYWEDQGIADYVRMIAGQEMGSKGHHIELVKKAGGFNDDEVLMLGDGDGDLKAVKSNNGLFYPIIPGREQQDWDDLSNAFKKFVEKKYKGEFEDRLISDFSGALSTVPPWEEPGYDHRKAYMEKQAIRMTLYQRFNPKGKLTIL